jgi:sugar phosphate permease
MTPAGNQEKSRGTLAWALWSMAAFFYAYQYILRVFPSVMKDSIAEKFAIDAQGMGAFSGAYYLGYDLVLNGCCQAAFW